MKDIKMKDIMKKTVKTTIMTIISVATGLYLGLLALLLNPAITTATLALFYVSLTALVIYIFRTPRKLPRFGRDILIESCQGEYHIGRDPFNPTTLIFAFYLIDRDDPYYGDIDQLPDWETDMDHPDFVGRGYLEELINAYDLCDSEKQRSYLNKLIKKLSK